MNRSIQRVEGHGADRVVCGVVDNDYLVARKRKSFDPYRNNLIVLQYDGLVAAIESDHKAISADSQYAMLTAYLGSATRITPCDFEAAHD